jgi:polyferredoxin
MGAPFLRLNGHPFILLDIASRKFIIFGAIFWAQDTFILALLMLSFVIFVVLFTVTFGRLWCGWACPQTIFMEMVFRKI